MSIVGDIPLDVIECGPPSEVHKEMVKHLRWRAQMARSNARDLHASAKDCEEQAIYFEGDAVDFDALANALEKAPVTFPASVDTRPQGGDAVEHAAPFTSGAVPPTAADAPAQPIEE